MHGIEHALQAKAAARPAFPPDELTADVFPFCTRIRKHIIIFKNIKTPDFTGFSNKIVDFLAKLLEHLEKEQKDG